MAADPLVALVSRALGVEVETVESERVSSDVQSETDRIRWSGPHGSGSLWFHRMAPSASAEVGLLPFLSRRGVAVPRVFASGIPPRHVKEPRPWVLTEEPPSETLCDRVDPALARRAGAALAALQAKTRRDASTLQALGLPSYPPRRVRDDAREAAELLPAEEAARLRGIVDRLEVETLSSLGQALVHGAPTCANLRLARGDIVLVGWSRAHLGCELEDVAALCAELRARDRVLALAAREGFGVPETHLRQAELLHWLFMTGWFAREARMGLGPREEGIALIRRAMAKAEKS